MHSRAVELRSTFSHLPRKEESVWTWRDKILLDYFSFAVNCKYSTYKEADLIHKRLVSLFISLCNKIIKNEFNLKSPHGDP